MCQKEKCFHHDKTFLIHAEYPTPFKCSFNKKTSDIDLKGHSEKQYMRSHIDMILFNPNFIDWIKDNSNSKYEGYEYVKGLRNELFSTYIKDFWEKYNKFSTDKQSILLFSIEFKYFRNGTEGNAAPLVAIKKDVNKLISLNNNKFSKFLFSQNVKSLVFLGNKNKKLLSYEPILKYKQKHNEVIEFVNR